MIILLKIKRKPGLSVSYTNNKQGFVDHLNDQGTPTQYSTDQNTQKTHNFKEFQTSECLMTILANRCLQLVRKIT